MKKLIAAMAALAMLAAISTTALAADVPSVTGGDGTTSVGTGNVLTTTTQIDTYSANIAWGNMTFAYDFGTWNPGTKAWSGAGWDNTKFDGTNDHITVENDSSQPITADFAYTATAEGKNNNVATTGTFTIASGNENGTKTNQMALALCPVGGLAPSDTTYLNLQGMPAASIGTAAKTIGTITVSLLDPVTTGATTLLGDISTSTTLTLPLGTTNDQATIETALLANATTAINNSAYKVTIAEGSTYTPDTTTGTWTGRFTVTNKTTETDTRTDASDRTINVTIGS
jgi:hypothetical protein